MVSSSMNLEKSHVADRFSAGIKDFIAGFKMWRMILCLGWEDIRQRYIRTFLGPLWMIVGTAIWIGVMSFVMASLFGNRVADTLPYITAGTLLWTFIGNTMNESCRLFIDSSNILHSINLPISVYILRFFVRNFIIFLHNLLILVIVFIICQVSLNATMLVAIPGMMVLILNAIWIGTLISILNTRYRDVQLLIATSMSVLPFVTPIFWQAQALKKHAWLANANPFYHAIEIVRAPLLGQEANSLSWIVMLSLTVIGIVFTLRFFTIYKNRIIYLV
jgi:ABC-2 type transport system permease protein